MLAKMRTIRGVIISPNTDDLHRIIDNMLRLVHELSPLSYISITFSPEEDDTLVPE